MEYPAIAQMLAKTIGLDAATLGETGLAHAVRGVMQRAGMNDENAFLDAIKSAPHFLEELLNAVTVPETWFFRDPKSFECLRQLAAEFKRENPARPFEILSLACCTGEEPYSAAITMFSAGMNDGDFHITAVDVNPRLLNFARNGVYTKKSFRALAMAPAGYMEKYFMPMPEGRFEIAQPIKQSVKFFEGNLASPTQLPRGTKYDAVFCRNVFIYLTPEVRQRVVDYIVGVMNETGILFVGPSEMVNNDRFEPLMHRHAFAYGHRREKPALHIPEVKHHQPRQAVVQNLPRNQTPKKRPVSRPAVEPDFEKKEEPNHDELLRQAREFADKGLLDMAERVCLDILDTSRHDSPDVFYLLGVIYSAETDFARAREYFRKALYLKPDHPETLRNMLLIARREGDAATELLFQKRLEKLMNNKEGSAV